ncbi:reverse transcriptase domain-containing protein [Tanacetum coccineum]
MPINVKTYNGSDDTEDHLNLFQAAAKVERWSIPTWCHMFNSTLIGSDRVWFDDLPPESIDSYDDLKKAFLANYLQQKKCIKDPVEIHHIKQREGESTEDFVERFKTESRHVRGAPECMKIFGFMHGITNPELIKRLHDNIPKSVDEMMRESGRKQNFDRKGDFQNQQRSERRRDKFTFLSKSPREILPLEKAKTREQKGSAKGGKKGRNVRKGHASSYINGPTVSKMARQRIIQSFSSDLEISFPPLADEEGMKGPMVIEAEIGGHFVHRIYVDEGSASKILYEHFFIRLSKEVKNQMVLATTPLVGFSGEIIWPMGQLSLLVKIGDEEYSTSVWMDFAVVRSESPYNGIIGRPGVSKIQSVASTACKMLKFPVPGGVLTLRSSKIIPLECSMVFGPKVQPFATNEAIEERIKVAIHPEYPEQTIAKGSTLTEDAQKALCDLLRHNLDEGCSPVRQKKRSQAPERNKAIQEEVEKLVDAGIIISNLQRLVDKAFQKQIGRNLEVYVDDLVIKSRTEDEIMRDIKEMFKTLREINMKLNPKKCTFRIEEGMFLGYKVNTKGIKVCPNKVEAVLSLPSQKCLKDVQKLNEKLASLNRFLSKSAEKSLSFFKTLKKCTKKSDFQWTTEAEVAFKQMKRLIAGLPTLTAPKEKEELIMYLAAAQEDVSAVLMTEKEAKQVPVYFVSRALQGLEINYTSMEKLVLALVHANKRLKRYFQAHMVIVITDQPIKQVLSKPKAAGRLQKWSIELGEYEIQYRPRTSIKGQILENSIVERSEDETGATPMEIEEELPDPWVLFTDGSFCVDGSGAGLILINPEGMEFTYALRFRFNEEILPEEKGYARAIRRKARRYAIINGVLYKKLYLGPWLRCVRSLQADYVLREIHEGSCSMHAGIRSVVAKPIRTGYYWPTMHADAKNMIRECQDYQVYRLVPRNPQHKLTAILSPWPFYKWGINIAEPFPEGLGKFAGLAYQGKQYLITESNSGIIHSKNGVRSYASVNASPPKDWIEEIPHVLWAHHTMIKSSNKYTQFSLTYGTEAVIPAEIGMPTLRTTKRDIAQNNEALEINLDLLKERKEQAKIRKARSKEKMEKYYNSKVRNTSFKPRDLVYRNNDASYAKDSGKLSLKWEGPYEVTEVLDKGAYKLKDRNGKLLPRSWNIRNLKKCYVHAM